MASSNRPPPGNDRIRDEIPSPSPSLSSSLPRTRKSTGGRGNKPAEAGSRLRHYSGSSVSVVAERPRSVLTSSLGEDDFPEAIGAFNPSFHSFSVELPPIRVGEYGGGGNTGGSLKRDKKRNKSDGSRKSSFKMSMPSLSPSLARRSPSLARRSPSPMWRPGELACSSFSNIIKGRHRSWHSSSPKTSKERSSPHTEVVGGTRIPDRRVSKKKRQSEKKDELSLTSSFHGVEDLDFGDSSRPKQESDQQQHFSRVPSNGSKQKPPKLSREYRDAVASRRRSTKGKQSTETYLSAAQQALGMERGGGAKTKSSFSRKSKESRNRRYRQEHEDEEKEFHRGVSTDVIAKYLEEMEKDDYEFLNARKSIKPVDEEPMEAVIVRPSPLKNVLITEVTEGARDYSFNVSRKKSSESEEPNWTWVNVGSDMDAEGIDDYVIPEVMVSDLSERPESEERIRRDTGVKRERVIPITVVIESPSPVVGEVKESVKNSPKERIIPITFESGVGHVSSDIGGSRERLVPVMVKGHVDPTRSPNSGRRLDFGNNSYREYVWESSPEKESIRIGKTWLEKSFPEMKSEESNGKRVTTTTTTQSRRDVVMESTVTKIKGGRRRKKLDIIDTLPRRQDDVVSSTSRNGDAEVGSVAVMHSVVPVNEPRQMFKRS
jgi:hypothetical protein